MAITPPSPPALTAEEKEREKKVSAWINSAPDGRGTGKPEPKRVMKGKQAQISHALPPALLDELDKFAERNDLKRANAINIAIRQMLRQGIVLNLLPADQGDGS